MTNVSFTTYKRLCDELYPMKGALLEIFELSISPGVFFFMERKMRKSDCIWILAIKRMKEMRLKELIK